MMEYIQIGNREPFEVKERPFKDVGIWLRPLQDCDNAAHELVGRIVSAFSSIEIMLGDLSLDLAHCGHYNYLKNFRTSFPRLITKKISFIRFCLQNNGPISNFKDIGLKVCDKIEAEFDNTRNLYAHSRISIDLLHSTNEKIWFNQETIKDDPEDNKATIFLRRSLSLNDIINDYKRVDRVHNLTSKCFVRLKRVVPSRKTNKR